MKLFTRTLFFRTILFALLLVCGAVPIKSSAQNTIPNDSVDENFVIASLLLADPGDVLYSTVGHVAIRLQCPDYELDYVFSYESEDVRQKVLSFLAGKLKMGMFAIPTEEYLDGFAQEHRGVAEYTINLPVEVKRNLWRVCDEHVAEGANLAYDYLTKGCAISALDILEEAIGDNDIDYLFVPEYLLTNNRREIVYEHLYDHLWTRFFLYLICNGTVTDDVSVREKIIIPGDLVTVLENAECFGERIITDTPNQLLPSCYFPKAHWFSPMLLSCIILFLTLLSIAFNSSSIMDYFLLSIQTCLGLVVLYLLFFSSLVCTESNPLIIPFNILPIVFWKWRRYWSLPYAIVLGIWAACALLWPYSLTDTPYIVISIALMASYINMFVRRQKNDDCF